MNNEELWSATSIPDPMQLGEELVEIAGTWDMGVDVSISNPFIFSNGPVYASPVLPVNKDTERNLD